MKNKLVLRLLSFAVTMSIVVSCEGQILAEDTEMNEEPQDVSVEDSVNAGIDKTDNNVEFIEEGVLEENVTVDFIYNNDELAEQFINREMSYAPQRSYSAYVYSRNLSESNAIVFNYLYGQILSIAEGYETSTTITIPEDVFYIDVPYDDYQSRTFSDILESNGFNSSTIIHALLCSCPYDLYWYDKTSGFSTSYSSRFVNGYSTIRFGLTFSFTVAGDYRGNDKYTIDSKYGESVRSAASNVRRIVSSNSGLDDYQKLLAYKNKICEMVDYNYNAAGGGASYGNPWQLIWVFDGDDSTKVVCEGYSKAFQFLCDSSSFDDDSVYALSVYGNVAFLNSNSGPHMWNIVHMDDGYNYAVDVTACDTTDRSFLKGASSGSARGYTLTNGDTYKYNNDMYSVFSDDDLIIASSDYVYGQPTVKPTATPSATPVPTKKPTDTPTPTKKVTVTPTPTKKITATPTPTKRPVSDSYFPYESLSLNTAVDCNCPENINFSDNRPKVIIFGDLYGCFNSYGTFFNVQDIKEEYSLNNIDVYCFQLIDVDLEDYKNDIYQEFSLGNGDYVIYDGVACEYDTSPYYSLYYWFLSRAVDEGVLSWGSTYSMPLVGFFDKDGKLKRITTEYLYPDDIKEAFTLIGADLKKPTATPTPTKKPTATPTKKPTATPTRKPTATPTPTNKPTATPTNKPTATPTPTNKPTATPTNKPTATPTPTAKPKAGWVEENGNWYYYDNTGKKVTGWLKLGRYWYFLNLEGVMETGWIHDGGKWYFLKANGSMAIGWIQIGDNWFYLGPSGAMVTGWQKIGGYWYYFSPAGYMATGWQKINGSWFFMSANGNMLTGWQFINGSWFYFDEDGYMQTGFIELDGKTYYMDPNGYMRTGWMKIDGKKYFFDASGYMFKGTHVISGIKFEFAEDGHCLNPVD